MAEADDFAREVAAYARELADAADAITLPAFLAGAVAEAKADGTPVTEADTAVEALIRGRLAGRYPDHAILGEELGSVAGSAAGAETRWIIDPIDATMNFTRGIQVWATLIAVEHRGQLVASVVSAPGIGQRWWAVRGAGATTLRGGRESRLAVSSVSRLEDAHLGHSGIKALDADGRGAGVRAVIGRARRDRGLGDFWGYMLVAQGAADAMFEVGLKPWDLAAPALIVTEAGGRFTDLDGVDQPFGPSALATNGRLHDELLALLARS